MVFALVAISSYLLGSVPFGLILTRLGGYGDIRDIGSGNIGATNVLRTGNKKLAAATLVLDSLKGAGAVIAAYYFATHLVDLEIEKSGAARDGMKCISDCLPWPDPAAFVQTCMYLAAFFALVGHLYPVWLKFRGGKGVATTFGTLLALKPIIGVAACGIWLLMAVVFRYSSLSALVAVASAPLLAHFLYGNENLTGLCGVIATLVFFKHRANIRRLLDKEEPKIGQKK